jgi:hypothetical protein
MRLVDARRWSNKLANSEKVWERLPGAVRGRPEIELQADPVHQGSGGCNCEARLSCPDTTTVTYAQASG